MSGEASGILPGEIEVQFPAYENFIVPPLIDVAVTGFKALLDLPGAIDDYEYLDTLGFDVHVDGSSITPDGFTVVTDEIFDAQVSDNSI